MKVKQTMTLAELFVEEYLEKKARLEELEKENHRIVKALKCAMNIVDDSRKMIDSLKIERCGDYINVDGFLDKRDDSFELFETEIEDREKMKKKEEEKHEEKEDDQKEEVEKDIEEETNNE